MAVIALGDQLAGHAGNGDWPLDRVVVLVKNLRTLCGDDDPVALLQIGNALGQRRQR